jgi:O-methyltransferase
MTNETLPLSRPTKLSPEQVGFILEQVKPFTMVPPAGVQFTAERVLEVIAAQIPGVVVECGTWRGGCSIAMLLAQRLIFGEVRRPVYMFDSFEGLPPAKTADGPLALAWQKDEASPIYFDNCRAELDTVLQALASQEFHEGDYHIVKGWFADTLPVSRPTLAERGIALLRLDGDWYDSTMTCFDQLAPLVAEEGIVILDDYYAWDGCARATHDYLSRNDLPYRLRSIPEDAGAYLIKRAFRRDSL